MSNLTDTDYVWAPSAYTLTKAPARLATHTTDDTSPHTAMTIAIADESVVDAVATVIGRSDDDQYFCVDLRAAYKRIGGTGPSVLRAPEASNPFASNPAGWSAVFDISGNDLLVKVNSNGDSVTWSVQLNTQVLSGFNPDNIPDLTFWITPDAGECTLGGGDTYVSAFNNRTGGTDPTISTDQWPSYEDSDAGFNYRATFKCVAGGADPKVVRAGAAAHGLTTGARTVVIVGQCKDANYAFGSPSGGTTIGGGGGGSGNKWQMTSDGTTWLVSSAGIADAPSVVIAVFDGASSKIYVNNTSSTNGDAGTLEDLSSATLMIGNYGAPSIGLGADAPFRHVMIYDRALDPSECAYLMGGLMAEVGL